MAVRRVSPGVVHNGIRGLFSQLMKRIHSTRRMGMSEADYDEATDCLNRALELCDKWYIEASKNER